MSASPPFVPTTRAVVLAALGAPLAVLIASLAPAAWIVAPALAGAFLALIVIDGLVAARLDDWRVIVPRDAEVGQPADITLLADFRRAPRQPRFALAVDPRLAGGGRIDGILGSAAAGGFRGIATSIPERRGIGAIEHIWIAWHGPLGLARRQVTAPLDEALRVRPDLSPLRSAALQALLRDAQFGMVARRLRGEGTQFEALVEYQPGMDRRRIDWKASARHTRLHARENETERNHQIVFAFDCGQAMCEPIDGLPRLDRAISAALSAAYVALRSGDRVSLYGFADRPQMSTPFIADRAAFHRLHHAASELDYMPVEPNFTLALASLSARLQRRSLIILFSDFTDPTAAELMIESVGRLLERHLVLFVTLVDSELEALRDGPPDDVEAVARAVGADALARQRALVLRRLRQMGVDVIEAPWREMGFRVLDRYLAIKQSGRIG